MDQRIQIQSLSQVKEGGFVVKGWEVVHDCWAKATWQSATETESIEQDVATRVCQFDVRYCPEMATVTEKDRVQWGSLIFEINACMPMPAGRPDIVRINATTRPDAPLAP